MLRRSLGARHKRTERSLAALDWLTPRIASLTFIPLSTQIFHPVGPIGIQLFTKRKIAEAAFWAFRYSLLTVCK